MTELKNIFTGKITNWSELGGADLPIVLINRASGSGTRHTFEQWVLDGEVSKLAQEQESTGMVRQIVATTPGAISYVAFSYVTDEVKALKVDGVEPLDKHVKTNKWKIWSYEHMYTLGEPKGLTKEYLDYMLSDHIQKEMVPQLGYIPVTEMKVERDARGTSQRLMRVKMYVDEEELFWRTSKEQLQKKSKKAKLEQIGKFISFLCILFIVVVVAAIFYFVADKGLATFFKDGVNLFDFLFGTTWSPGNVGENGEPLVGALPMIMGSFLVTLLSAIVATPFAIGAAVFMTEISPTLGKKILQPVIELLVGIPSVVYGFVGLTVIVPGCT